MPFWVKHLFSKAASVFRCQNDSPWAAFKVDAFGKRGIIRHFDTVDHCDYRRIAQRFISELLDARLPAHGGDRKRERQAELRRNDSTDLVFCKDRHVLMKCGGKS